MTYYIYFHDDPEDGDKFHNLYRSVQPSDVTHVDLQGDVHTAPIGNTQRISLTFPLQGKQIQLAKSGGLIPTFLIRIVKCSIVVRVISTQHFFNCLQRFIPGVSSGQHWAFREWFRGFFTGIAGATRCAAPNIVDKAQISVEHHSYDGVGG